MSARLLHRVVAFAIDLGLVVTARALVRYALFPVATAHTTNALAGLGPTLLLHSIPLVYFISQETGFATTVGKRVLGLTITAAHNQPIALTDIVRRRWWFALVAPIDTPVGFGFLLFAGWAWWTAFIDPHQRGFHDRHAHTRVVTTLHRPRHPA